LIGRIWRTNAEATGRFLDEAGFRILLAWPVLRGHAPRQVEKRFWNRNAETPVLLDVYDWVDERRIFSVLIWPSLESDADDGAYQHMQRVDQVKEVIAQGATEMAWQTRFETDFGLEWDSERRVWVTADGFAYDGKVRWGEGVIANG
jgi:hypothetical protein